MTEAITLSERDRRVILNALMLQQQHGERTYAERSQELRNLLSKFQTITLSR